MNPIADFRSDTVTRPTPEMRQAMFEAEVGDDVLGEDPSVNRLEARAAEITGKEAALFVPSGTMGNQIAIRAHTQPGEEIICEDRAHIVLYEMGMGASFSGCLFRTVTTESGLLTWDDIAPRLRPASDHFRGTSLIEIENTANMAGGRVYPLAQIREIAENAHAANVKVHIDGARVFNAATALGRPVSEIVAPVDSVMFCLSKGLGAPVGSILAGPADFIAKARDIRKGLGGGMRQAGVIASAGLVALENSPAGLPEAHANAKFLAESLATIDGIELDPPLVETNIVFFRVTQPGQTAKSLRENLKSQGILVSGSADRIRMLTHHDVTREDCERAIAAIH